MQLLYYSLLFALPALAASGSDEKKVARTPCAIKSPTTGAFFDLNQVRLELPPEGKKPPSDQRNVSWPARGWDYGANFTLNICGPVIEKLEDVVGVPQTRWKNVSAYYEKSGKIYSIGQQNDEPIIRGRKLVLNYTHGSPCPSLPTSSLARGLDYQEREIIGGGDDEDDDPPRKKPSSKRPSHDDDEDEDGKKKPTDSTGRRKSTIISLLCASDPLAPPMAVSFVASPDSCTYFFEARTPAACGGVETAQQTLSPGGVFGVIATIAVLVYLVGGCFYQRTVMHQRGWRQLPNYSLWAGIGSFFADIFVIATSSCARFFPSRQGYNRLGANGFTGSGNGNGRRGRNDSDDENRLIDQLDEEWDD
ncbi:Mannose-6-phosphate receptor-like protein [Elsinoe fawcettii]|nr:Mannose-6-phosphate receptor-like protein [Elsinoe fawcettii]